MAPNNEEDDASTLGSGRSFEDNDNFNFTQDDDYNAAEDGKAVNLFYFILLFSRNTAIILIIYLLQSNHRVVYLPNQYRESPQRLQHYRI
jgi:hypothetical protein